MRFCILKCFESRAYLWIHFLSNRNYHFFLFICIHANNHRYEMFRFSSNRRICIVLIALQSKCTNIIQNSMSTSSMWQFTGAVLITWKFKMISLEELIRFNGWSMTQQHTYSQSHNFDSSISFKLQIVIVNICSKAFGETWNWMLSENIW